jgi:hypothetical protein
MIELLIATVVLAVIGAPITAVMYSASAQQALAQQRTAADQLASAQVETVRGLDYESVGTVGGNPPGVITATQVKTISGGQVNLVTQVAYVQDQVLNNPVVTYADYKRVTVTVSGAQSGKVLAQKMTYAASPGAAPSGGLDWVTIKANLTDYVLAAPVTGTAVSITAPAAQARTDTTDGNGQVIFPALSAGTFQLAVPSPYVILKEDRAGATKALTAGTLWTTTLRIYEPASISLGLLNSSGQNYNGTATVVISSNPDRGTTSQSLTFTNGLATLTTFNGEPIVPNVSYTISAAASGSLWAPAVTQLVPTSYPTVLSSPYTLRLASYATAVLTVTVKRGSSTVSGAAVTVSSGPCNVYLTGTTNSSGVATFTVPKAASPAYTVNATSGSYKGSSAPVVNGATATTVTIS